MRATVKMQRKATARSSSRDLSTEARDDRRAKVEGFSGAIGNPVLMPHRSTPRLPHVKDVVAISLTTRNGQAQDDAARQERPNDRNNDRHPHALVFDLSLSRT